MENYFDNNATTPCDERVVAAMLPFFRQHSGNPSSLYQAGRFGRDALEIARQQVSDFAGCHPSELVFTSGGTEANNWAIHSYATQAQHKRCIVSSIEHPSVATPVANLRQHGWQVEKLAVNSSGEVITDQLEQLLQQPADFVAIMGANNETGVVQPLAGVADTCAANSTPWHCDVVQLAGKLPFNYTASAATSVSLSAHKIYGPKGVGALIIDKKRHWPAMLAGGSQEKGYRSGTENVPAIVGFGKAAELAKQEQTQRQQHLQHLLDILQQQLQQHIPQATLFCEQAEQKLPNTLMCAMDGIDGETLIMALDRAGFSLSSGSACSSSKTTPSEILLAMGVEPQLALGAIRISLGLHNSEASVRNLVATLRQQIDGMQRFASMAW